MATALQLSLHRQGPAVVCVIRPVIHCNKDMGGAHTVSKEEPHQQISQSKSYEIQRMSQSPPSCVDAFHTVYSGQLILICKYKHVYCGSVT